MTELKLKRMIKAYGTHEVIHGIELTIKSGELIVFVGPSGCGKSTLLRMIAGLEDITSGRLEFDGHEVSGLPPLERGIAMVFQSYALYPHMTVFDNMAFALKLSGWKRADIENRVAQTAEMLQMTEYLDRLPKQLSGGQRQRVAIGRAIARDPKVFLFDEPLSNLDAALRVATRIEIARLHERMPETTMVYVTHDQIEAMTLADRIVVLNDGRIEQIGTPIELYRNPRNLFVARFIGSPAMNILPSTVAANETLALPNGRTAPLPMQRGCLAPGAAVTLGVRPEDLEIAADGTGLLSGKVSFVEQLGEYQLVHLGELPIIAKVSGEVDVKKGATIELKAAGERLHVFGADGVSLRHADAERASEGAVAA